MFKASFSSCTVKKVSATDNGLHHSSLGHSFAFVYYFLFRHLVKVLRTGALFDSGRAKVAKEEQRIWLFNQSNRSIDLNQLISAKRGNSSSSFCDERNIYSTFVRAGKQGSKQPNSERNETEEK